MERFKNEHLENLWGNLVPYIGGTCTAGEIADIVKLFEDCDEAIEDEADDCEHWKTMYGNACKEIDQAKECIRLQERIIERYRTAKTAAEKERDEYKSLYENLCKFLGKWRNAKIRDDFADPQELKELKDEIASLKESLDILKKSNEALLSANMDLAMEKRKLEDSLNYAMIQQLEARIEELTAQLKDANNKTDRCEKDLADAKKQMGYFTTSRDNWRARAKHAEEVVDNIRAELEAKVKRMDEITKERDSYHDLYTELSKAFDKQSAKIEELKTRLNSMCNVKYGEYVRSRDTGYKNGQIDLWNKLQNVNDAKPFELATCFPDVSCMDDILSWDLEDFLDAYKSWQEAHEHERIIKDACDAFYYGFKAGLASEVPVD